MIEGDVEVFVVLLEGGVLVVEHQVKEGVVYVEGLGESVARFGPVNNHMNHLLLLRTGGWGRGRVR